MVFYTLKVTEIKEEAKDTKTYYMEKPEEFIWVEGAHAHIGMIGFNQGDKPNKNLVRHMTIMSLPEENKVGITTRIKENPSEFKQRLSKIQVGDELVIFKVGSRMELRRNNRPIVLLSMGVGIATMRPVIHGFTKDGAGITSLHNVNVDSSKEYVYRKELDELQKDNLINYWVESRKDLYETITKLTEVEDAIYYIVGSDDFITDVIKLLRTQNVGDESIILDKREEMREKFFAS